MGLQVLFENTLGSISSTTSLKSQYNVTALAGQRAAWVCHISSISPDETVHRWRHSAVSHPAVYKLVKRCSVGVWTTLGWRVLALWSTCVNYDTMFSFRHATSFGLQHFSI